MAAHGHGWPGPGTRPGTQWGTSWACQHLGAGTPLPRAGPALRSSWEELESRPGCGPRPELCPPQGRQQWAQPLLGAPARPLPQASPSPWPCTYGARARVCTTGFLTLNTASGDQSCADHLACSPWPTPLRPPRTHGSPRASPPVCLCTCHTQSAGLCLPRAQAAHPRPSRLSHSHLPVSNPGVSPTPAHTLRASLRPPPGDLRASWVPRARLRGQRPGSHQPGLAGLGTPSRAPVSALF